MTTILSSNLSFSQEVKDRNGNGIIEESDYWTTSDRYTEEYMKNYNKALDERAARYNRNNPNTNKFGGNVI